jgi:hypothetical protein
MRAGLKTGVNWSGEGLGRTGDSPMLAKTFKLNKWAHFFLHGTLTNITGKHLSKLLRNFM